MNYRIREARPEDGAALAKLNREEMGYDFPPCKTEAKLKRLLADGRNCILVAQCGRDLVGYVHLVEYDVLYAEPMMNVMGIAVSADCRRMGVGKSLLAEAERRAKLSGAAAVRLNSGETRTGAHAFYRSLGYHGSKMQLNLKKEL